MRRHDELDQLSALVDGELDKREQTALETHVATCEDCRVTLDALRATLADLRELPEPVPTEQDSWALRSAIRRARTPARKWQRLAWASGAAAASVIAVVAIVASLGGNSGSGTLTAAEDARGGGRELALTSTATNYDAASAQARLLSVSGIAKDSYFAGASPTPATVPPQATSGGGHTEARAANPASGYSAADSANQELERCVATVRSSTQELLTPVQFEAASFDGRAAFLLFFRTQDRFELWVVAPPTCETLYFAQAG